MPQDRRIRLRRGSGEAPKILERVEAGAVTVSPARLERIPSDVLPAHEFKTGIRVTHVWPRDVAENIRLAPARSAGAGAPERLQAKIGLGAVVPSNRQLAADELDVGQFQAHGR